MEREIMLQNKQTCWCVELALADG